MWYWIGQAADESFLVAAKAYGETVMTQPELPRQAEAVFLCGKTMNRIEGIGVCIAVNPPEETGSWTYVAKEPFDRLQLVRIVRSLCGRLPEREPPEMEEACLDALAVPQHLLGYRYLRQAISLVRTAEHPMQLSMMHDVYPAIAQHFNSTPIMVNRAIRHAIDYAWKRADIAVQRSYFGYSAMDKKGVPTNVEFLFAICERLRLLRGTD